MSDLSRLLDDVYRSGSGAAGPAWASDDALDEVFADWVPGPPADAPEAERAYANTPEAAEELAATLEVEEAPDPAPAPDPFEPLQALLEQALRQAPDEPERDEQDEPVVDLVGEPEVVGEPELVVEPAPILVLEDGTDHDFVAPTPVLGWRRSDDDILPTGKARRGLFRRR